MGGSGLGAKRIGRALTNVSLDGMERKCRSLWLDSGAHSLFNLHCFRKVGDEMVFKPRSERYKWFSRDGVNLSKRFIAYMDAYAQFVREHEDGIDYYATVDVIYNPELSWKSIRYLEKEHGLKPVPVIHHRTPLAWVRKYLDAGYEYVGLGGLGQKSTKHSYHQWADTVYDLLCDNKDRLPCVRTHGFAMTSFPLLRRYPWWSTDSTSAFKVAGNGGIYIPHKRNGKFTFDIDPYVLALSHRSSVKGKPDKHFANLEDGQKEVVLEWLKVIDMPLGVMGDNEQVIEYGVASEYNARALANLKFFQKMCEALPKWPWPFKIKPSSTFFKWEKIK